jgi:hypothetical protein
MPHGVLVGVKVGVAVGSVPVGEGVIVRVLVDVKVGVFVGQIPTAIVKINWVPVLSDAVLHEYCV